MERESVKMYIYIIVVVLVVVVDVGRPWYFCPWGCAVEYNFTAVNY